MPCGGLDQMRFVAFVWVLILSSLLLFTFVLFSQNVIATFLPPLALEAGLLVTTWAIGLLSAGAVHLMYRRAEKAIERSARDQTVVELAGAVAHEMNQPLTVIISCADMMSHRNRSPDEMAELASRMAESSERMADIVSKLQGATSYRSKPYVGNVRIVDLDKVG